MLPRRSSRSRSAPLAGRRQASQGHRGEGPGVQGHRQGGAHAPDGRDPPHAGSGDGRLGRAARLCRGRAQPIARRRLRELALGGTAVRDAGLNTHPKWARTASPRRSPKLSGVPFKSAPNKFAALAGHEALVAASGAMRVLAVACFKIASDVRLLGSGPRCGHRRAAPPGERGRGAASCRAKG